MNSLRRQLTFFLLAYGPGLLLAGFLCMYFLVRKDLYEQFDESLRTHAQVIAEEIEEAIPDQDQAILEEEMAELEAYSLLPPYYEVTSSGGQRILASRLLEMEPAGFHLSRPLQLDEASSVDCPDGQPGRVLTVSYGSTANPFLVTVLDYRTALDSDLKRILFPIGLAGVLFVAFALVVGPWLLNRMLSPLNLLNKQILEIDAQSLEVRIPGGSLPVELRPVAERINGLLERLADSFEKERRINANLAHEIRTPLAELKLLAETALKWPESRDPETDAEYLAIIRHLETMINRMLELARSEEGSLEVHMELIDLDSLVRQSWKPLAKRAASRSLAPDIELGAGEVYSDPVLLGKILLNLLENAVDYSPAGSKINTSSERNSDGGVLIRVRNAAPSLSPEDLQHLGERYWRKGSAREDRHLGIGTSIVRAYCAALGGNVAFTLSEGDLIAELQFPPRSWRSESQEESSKQV